MSNINRKKQNNENKRSLYSNNNSNFIYNIYALFSERSNILSMRYYRKNCEYKYRYKLNRRDRIKIHLMMLREEPIQKICKKYGLTKQFLKCKHQHLLGKTTPVALNGKTDSYYENEMDYGKLNLEYKWDSLSESEIKFYENNRKQNIS